MTHQSVAAVASTATATTAAAAATAAAIFLLFLKYHPSHMVIYIWYNLLLGLVGRVFANGPRDRGSIPGRVIPKTLKMALDTYLFNTQQYKVRIKDKVELSRERSSALPYTSVS